MTDFRQGQDASLHDDGLLFAIEDLLDGNGASSASVDNAFIIFHWHEDTPFVKHGPEFVDEVVAFRLLIGMKVRYIYPFPQSLLVLFWNEGGVEAGINRAVEVRHQMTQLP